ALEAGIPSGEAGTFQTMERAALSAAARIVTTSHTTAQVLMSDYGVPERRLIVAPPGTDEVPPARGSSGGPLALLAVGALVPRKGYDGFIAALAKLGGFAWGVTIFGDPARAFRDARRIATPIARSRIR